MDIQNIQHRSRKEDGVVFSEVLLLIEGVWYVLSSEPVEETETYSVIFRAPTKRDVSLLKKESN